MVFGLEAGLGGSLHFGVPKTFAPWQSGKSRSNKFLCMCGMLCVHHKTFGVCKSFLERVWRVLVGENGEKW